MNLYIYTDESGVLDSVHNDYFVFGGVMYLSKGEKEIAERKYLKAERDIKHKYLESSELKANYISNSDKGKLFRSLNNTIRFGAVINQHEIHDKIFSNKKTKQRYLDYVYKLMIKKILINLDKKGEIRLDEIENISIYCDEHTTATDGKYELREAILEELKNGTFNQNYNIFFEPICVNLKDIKLNFYDSKKKILIRAADIVANKIFYNARQRTLNDISDKVFLVYFP